MQSNTITISIKSILRVFAAVFAMSILIMSKTIFASDSAATSIKSAAQNEVFHILPSWFHVHLKLAGDDGEEPAGKTVDYLKSKGYRGIVFTPHSGGIAFNEYVKEIMQYGSPDFVVVPGREISVRNEDDEESRVMCHINAVSEAASPKNLNGKFKWDKLDELLSELNDENAVYVWNHPWCCERWKEYAGKFNGIELFNDFGPGYAEGKTYDFNKEAYLDAIKKNKRIFVVSGIDMHGHAQTMLGDFTTYFLTDEFSAESILKALRNGNTIAAFNAKLDSINERPSIIDKVSGGEIRIEGAASLKTAGGKRPSLVVYKNGEVIEPSAGSSIERGKKGSRGYTSYSFSFGDTLAPGSSACYIFEIPRYMFSSPYCYIAQK